MEKDITKYLDNEDLEILRNIIFERFTFYTNKIVENSSLMAKAENEEVFVKHKNDYEYNCKVKDVLDAFYEYLLEICIEE